MSDHVYRTTVTILSKHPIEIAKLASGTSLLATQISDSEEVGIEDCTTDKIPLDEFDGELPWVREGMTKFLREAGSYNINYDKVNRILDEIEEKRRTNIDSYADQFIADRNVKIEKEGVQAALGIDMKAKHSSHSFENGPTLKELKVLVDRAVDYAGNRAEHSDVEVWLGPKAYRIATVTQFGVIPTLSIELGDMCIDIAE
jgi:hypothetical protein